jgi:hypothetical protein
MNKLLQLVTEEDIWTLAEGESEGTPFMLRYRPNLQEFIATAKYNRRLAIVWKYQSDNSSLMPADEDVALMEAVENALVDLLENDVQAVLAFVYTGQNQKEWHWYSSDMEETGNRLNEALSAFDVLPLELSSEDDPEWAEYLALLENVEQSAPEDGADGEPS